MDYNPTPDFNTAWEAVNRRIKTNYAGQRAGQQGDLAARGVATSGVSQIPLESTNRAEGNDISDAAGQFALSQAETGIEDRRRREDFARQKQLMSMGYGFEDAMNRRLAQNQLTGGLIAGGLGAAGGYLSRK
jgi:hypothetical protein